VPAIFASFFAMAFIVVGAVEMRLHEFPQQAAEPLHGSANTR
jgi:hypothetical protein